MKSFKAIILDDEEEWFAPLENAIIKYAATSNISIEIIKKKIEDINQAKKFIEDNLNTFNFLFLDINFKNIPDREDSIAGVDLLKILSSELVYFKTIVYSSYQQGLSHYNSFPKIIMIGKNEILNKDYLNTGFKTIMDELVEVDGTLIKVYSPDFSDNCNTPFKFDDIVLIKSSYLINEPTDLIAFIGPLNNGLTKNKNVHLFLANGKCYRAVTTKPIKPLKEFVKHYNFPTSFIQFSDGIVINCNKINSIYGTNTGIVVEFSIKKIKIPFSKTKNGPFTNTPSKIEQILKNRLS